GGWRGGWRHFDAGEPALAAIGEPQRAAVDHGGDRGASDRLGPAAGGALLRRARRELDDRKREDADADNEHEEIVAALLPSPQSGQHHEADIRCAGRRTRPAPMIRRIAVPGGLRATPPLMAAA